MSPTEIHRARPVRIETLREALGSGAMQQVRSLIQALNPGEIADLLESSPPAQRKIVWELVDHRG